VSGTRLLIHIKENEEELKETEEPAAETAEYGYNIVATKDAVVTEVVMRSGTPAVKAQSEVHTGDVLVYGRYDVVNDDGEVTRTQYLSAEAEIYGQVIYAYDYELPLRYTKKEYGEKQKKSYALRIGDEILKLPESKTKEETDKFSEEKQLSLYGNFYLPIYLVKNTEKTYTEKEYVYTEEQAEEVCEENLSYFLQKLEKNTIQIVQKDVTIEIDGENCHCSGSITVIENIGQSVPAVLEEITGETTTDYE
jgi:similar to stage IV sporulation protein